MGIQSSADDVGLECSVWFVPQSPQVPWARSLMPWARPRRIRYPVHLFILPFYRPILFVFVTNRVRLFNSFVMPSLRETLGFKYLKYSNVPRQECKFLALLFAGWIFSKEFNVFSNNFSQSSRSFSKLANRSGFSGYFFFLFFVIVW